MIIKNFAKLAKTNLRKQALLIADAGLAAINTGTAIKSQVRVSRGALLVKNKRYPLQGVKRIFVAGVGKCAVDAALTLEKILGSRLSGGIVLDLRATNKLKKIKSYKGSHPIPSQANVFATKRIIELLNNLGNRDLVICIVSGGGSTLLCQPSDGDPAQEAKLLKQLFHAGADIKEINTLRKHISMARGGFLAKYAYPAQAISLIFSDVIGNDFGIVASGPTVRDKTTIKDAQVILKKYHLPDLKMIETPKENKYFKNVKNILFVSNHVALSTMKKNAQTLGLKAQIVSDHIFGEASEVGSAIARKLKTAKPGTVQLYGGETTVTIKGAHGKGGRNQELALAALKNIKENEIITAINSDGWDNTEAAGALCDIITKEDASKKKLHAPGFLQTHNSYEYFRKVGGLIKTGRLGSNVADLLIALKSK